jgi:hypothetical protein
MFFFEKKNQKTFVLRSKPVQTHVSKEDKSFLLLFFKKEVLPYLLASDKPPGNANQPCAPATVRHVP